MVGHLLVVGLEYCSSHCVFGAFESFGDVFTIRCFVSRSLVFKNLHRRPFCAQWQISAFCLPVLSIGTCFCRHLNYTNKTCLWRFRIAEKKHKTKRQRDNTDNDRQRIVGHVVLVLRGQGVGRVFSEKYLMYSRPKKTQTTTQSQDHHTPHSTFNGSPGHPFRKA